MSVFRLIDWGLSLGFLASLVFVLVDAIRSPSAVEIGFLLFGAHVLLEAVSELVGQPSELDDD